MERISSIAWVMCNGEWQVGCQCAAFTHAAPKVRLMGNLGLRQLNRGLWSRRGDGHRRLREPMPFADRP